MINVLNVPFVIDLGNGFAKRIFGKGVKIEQAIFSKVPTYYNKDSYAAISFSKGGKQIYIGDDVIKSSTKGKSALGEDEIERYSSDEFNDLFLGFIAKDLKHDVIIPHLVTGLPVNHFTAKREEVQNKFTGKKIVYLNDRELMFDIKKVHVIPQPLGTYMYLVANDLINSDDEETLVIDGGYGSFDVTALKGETIIDRAGDEIGVKNAYVEIQKLLIDKLGESKNLTIQNMPNLLQKGYKQNGNVIDIYGMDEVQSILRDNFNEAFEFVRDNRFDLKSYDNVVWTGGFSKLYIDFINEIKRDNFIILGNAQEANALGYYEYGKALMEEDETYSNVRWWIKR